MIDDLSSWEISEGFIIIYSHKFFEGGSFAKFLGKGKLTIPYSDMPNGQLFILLMDNLISEE